MGRARAERGGGGAYGTRCLQWKRGRFSHQEPKCVSQDATKREQNTQKEGSGKEIAKVKAEINEMKNRKSIGKKINDMDKCSKTDRDEKGEDRDRRRQEWDEGLSRRSPKAPGPELSLSSPGAAHGMLPQGEESGPAPCKGPVVQGVLQHSRSPRLRAGPRSA